MLLLVSKLLNQNCIYDYHTLTGSSKSRTAGAAIGGAIGGFLFFIIFVLLVVLLVLFLIKHSNIRNQEDQYDNMLKSKFSVQEEGTIKMDINPSYGRVQAYNTTDNDVTNCEPDHDITVQINPSYDSVMKNTKTVSKGEDENGYVETNLHNTQTVDYLKVTGSTSKKEEPVYDVATDDVNINPNPSYESVSRDVKLEDNPSYNKIKHMHI